MSDNLRSTYIVITSNSPFPRTRVFNFGVVVPKFDQHPSLETGAEICRRGPHQSELRLDMELQFEIESEFQY